MVSRSQFLTVLAASLALSYGCAKNGHAAEITYRVLAEGSAPVSPIPLPNAAWAHLEQGGQFVPQIDAGSDAKGETNLPLLLRGVGAKQEGHVSLALTNQGDAPARLELTVPLVPGLWRAEMAVAATDKEASPLRAWRMESVFQKDDRALVKTLAIAPGQTLLVRWTETGAEAAAARRRVRDACAKTSNEVLQSRVSSAMEPIDDTLSVLGELTRRGDRDKIVKRIHTALLATAKAQALWQNWRDSDLIELDAVFADLVEALSEISCAAHNLVPSQTLVRGADGKPATVRLSVTNAGPRTVPLVALGLSRKEGKNNSDLKVFRSVAPGAVITANFPVPAGEPEDTHGIVQFISDMGAAVVSACPAP